MPSIHVGVPCATPYAFHPRRRPLRDTIYLPSTSTSPAYVASRPRLSASYRICRPPSAACIAVLRLPLASPSSVCRSHRCPHTPVGGSVEGIGQFNKLLLSMKNGSDYNSSEMRIPVHSGTHVDAPDHFYYNYYDACFDVDSLDLRVLNGAALFVDVPRDKNITAQAPYVKKEFDTSFVGFMTDEAQWLVDNTDIKLVGTDYLSVAAFVEATPAHFVFLKSREHILVEGLKLDNVEAGIYSVHCLPLRLVGAEGSPIRCILIK
ncbi:hypothetical protein ACS0TY_026280 [Phlomoides rotata]